MKIARIDAYRADLPVAGGVYHLSGGRSYTAYDATILRVTATDGSEGWGESTPFGATYIASHAAGVRAALPLLAPVLLGRDPRRHERLYDAMDAVLAGHRDAKAALDTACWDLHGRSTGQPLCDLIGGRVPGRVPLISSIGGDAPEAMRARVAAHRAQGFRAHSVKIGASEDEGGPSLDAARITACLADRQPGEWFLADANGGMRPENALRLLALLPAGTDIVLEAPCAGAAEIASFRARCPLPLLLDETIRSESDLAAAVAGGLCDGIGLKVTKQGGVTPLLRQYAIARAAGMVVTVQDTVGSEISFATILHLAQAMPRDMMRAALDPRSMVTASLAAFDAPIRDGGAEAPEAPGLGVTPDLAALTPIASWE